MRLCQQRYNTVLLGAPKSGFERSEYPVQCMCLETPRIELSFQKPPTVTA